MQKSQSVVHQNKSPLQISYHKWALTVCTKVGESLRRRQLCSAFSLSLSLMHYSLVSPIGLWLKTCWPHFFAHNNIIFVQKVWQAHWVTFLLSARSSPLASFKSRFHRLLYTVKKSGNLPELKLYYIFTEWFVPLNSLTNRSFSF